MNTKDREVKKEMQKSFEKNVFTSKKSALVFIVETMLFTLAILTLRWQPNVGWPLAPFMVAIIFAMGFILLVYIGKQSLVDAWTRGMALSGKVPNSVFEKLFGSKGKKDQEEVTYNEESD